MLTTDTGAGRDCVMCSGSGCEQLLSLASSRRDRSVAVRFCKRICTLNVKWWTCRLGTYVYNLTEAFHTVRYCDWLKKAKATMGVPVVPL